LSWTDDSQEVRVNLGYPVADLPTDAPLSAIEFRNLAEYRVRFRSVVFVNERAAAPQDPPESPLVRASSPQERMLLPEAIAALRGASITIYRGGRLSESTLPAEARQELLVLPRAVASAESTLQASVATGGSRRLVLYSPLRGDGWDGATLALSVTDPDWIAAARHDSRLGLLFCSLSAPFLLVLLSELLAMAASLRFRLIAVTTVAALAPLGLLSLVLVRVLESGHAVDVEEGMRAAVRSAAQQLEDQKAKVRQSAERWLDDLQKLAGEKVASWNETQLTTAVPEVAAALQQLLNGQLPPEWRGGFLRLDWQPRLGKATTAPVGLAAGDERVAMVEVPARLEPGVFMQQGELILGVRAETAGRGGSFVLTAGRPLDGNLLSSLAPGRDLLLTDVRGYPLRVSSASGKEDDLLLRAKDPATMAQCERSLALGVEQRQPIVHRGNPAVGDFVYGSEVLRDLQDTPRAMLVLAQPDQRATLDLTVGAIPVRAFFLLVAGSLVVLAVFLSFVVSGRISRPIEQLAAGAQALSRGQLDTRVPVDDGGQIGRLTRAFNQMAADLQARLQDLQALNRTMSELAAEHDEATTRDVLHRFCRANTSADAIAIVLADPAGQRLVVHRGGEVEPGALPLAALPMVVLAGAFASVSRGDGLPAPWADLLPGQRSLVGLPLVFGGQARGVVLLGFTRVPPLPVDLELLSTVVAQAAVAFERSQLQRVAVQDPVTGALTPDFFRRRITDEVSVAQQRGRPLAMLAIAFGAGDRRPRGLRRFAAFLREQLPSTSITAHVGGGQFQIALPGQLRERAEATLAALTTAWEELVRQLPENEVENQPPAGVVVAFPAEAPSAEFLFEALRARLEALHTPGASAMESDETLQRAGVTVVSPAMRAVYGDLRRVAPTDIPILLEGETGVGKEVLTNLVHRWSRRAGGPLVRVHCAALSETLLASELFGHEKGAFTGAERRKIGRFEQADGGTLFLDEVGEIPLDVQVKLLRVLQEGEVDRVGGNEPVKVDVRVVAATNRDIARMVAEGRFREDLYYRLQGMVVKVPPLRERKQELSTLVEHFRAEIIAEGHAPVRAWSTDALDELYRHDWPGNIRQLRNTVFRAMVLAPGSVVVARDVLAALSDRAGSGGAATAAPVLASLPVASDDAADPVVVVPRPPVVPAAAGVPTARRIAEPDPAPARALPSGLSPRLLGFLADAVARGTCSTADHMQQRGLSHRTALRDAQQLVQFGLLERVGSRRGAFYRPTPAAGRFLGDLTPPWPTAESSPPASG
jgi:HAMP domain-containing protein/GGDEF domain-containing protein